MTATTSRAQEELVARRGATTDGRAGAEPAPPPIASISFVTAEELGATVGGPIVNVPPDQKAAADAWIAGYKSRLIAQTDKALQEQDRPGAALGGPIVGSYVAYDIVAVSPIQFVGNPPHLPHKIVAGGELMLLQALQWINPRVSIPEGFLNPATLQLSGRHLRVRFDQLNLTTGGAGPSFTFDINPLPVPAPTFILFSLFMVAPPVSQTQLIEVNVTSDIVGMAQPFAAFATWHQDVDSELPWLAPAPANFPPQVAPALLHNAPMRYMVYPK